MKQLKKLFEANFKSTFREKQVWFWSIFYPVLLLVIFLTIFGGAGDDEESDFKATIAVVADAGQEGGMSSVMTGALKQIPILEWKEEEPVTRDKAEDFLKNKEVDAVIVISDGNNGKQVELLLNREKENSTLAQAMVGLLNEVIHQMNYRQAGIVPDMKLDTQYLSSGSESIRYTDFLLTGLIALSISQAGMFGMISMVEMRRSGLLKRLRLTPVSMRMYGVSNILVRFILSAIQVALLAVIGIVFYGASLDIDPLAFLLIFAVGTVSFAAIGYLIASVSKSMDSYFGIANLTSFIMMFLSGIFFDYSMLPDYIKPIADFIPLTYFANGVRDGMVYGLSIMEPSFWVNIGILAAWGVATFALGSRLYGRKADAG